MKRRWKVLLGLLALLAVLLAVNTVTTQSQTKEAERTVEGAQHPRAFVRATSR